MALNSGYPPLSVRGQPYQDSGFIKAVSDKESIGHSTIRQSITLIAQTRANGTIEGLRISVKGKQT